MRGEKTVQFQDWTFTYSKGGKFVEGNSITVREPGLGKFAVYTTMSAYVAEAMAGIAERRASRKAPVASEPAPEQDAVPDEDSDEQEDCLIYMRMGLPPERYHQFMVYLKTALTGSPKLAHVGGEEKAAITEEVWESIDDRGGMSAVMQVMSEFTSFFFDALESKSRKTSGGKSSTTSASPLPATSPTSAPVNSRLRKS